MKSIVTILFTVIFSVFSNAQTTIKAPGSVFDLSGFNLQLPLAKGNSIQQILDPELKTYSSDYFYLSQNPDAIILTCHSDGAHTKGSHYPRTELRDKIEWNFIGEHSMSIQLAVLQQPSTGKIIIGQIHGNRKGTEAVKIWWNNGKVQVGVKEEVDAPEKRYTLLNDVTLNQVLDYSIKQSGRSVNITINGQSVDVTFGDSWYKEKVYFKVGNYLQDNLAPVSTGIVALYKVERKSN